MMTVQVTVTVALDPPRGFDLLVESMNAWWPEEVHVLHGETCEVIVESHSGGRWFERALTGERAELDWGRVLAYEPAGRLVLAWQLSPKPGWDPAVDEDPGMRYDPEVRTELELTLTPVPGEGTRVALEHRKLESLGEGEGADVIRALLAGDEVGWRRTSLAITPSSPNRRRDAHHRARASGRRGSRCPAELMGVGRSTSGRWRRCRPASE